MSTHPLAPRHPREDLHRFVNQLNVRYGIGIPIPDPALSSSERKEQGSTSTRLYTRLEVHFYQGGVDTLHALTKQFDREAKKHWSKWVKKPKGDLGTLPRTDSALLPANDTERQWLQTLFHEVLDRSQPTRSFGRTQSGPAAYSMERTTNQSKRVAEVDMGRTPTKRPKPIEQIASAVLPGADDIFVAPKPASVQSRHSSARTAESLHKSFYSLKSETTMGSSLNTSRASFASVFSNQHPGPLPTQDTVEASTQEQIRRPDPCPREFHPPSSTAKEALHSFDNYETSSPKGEIQDALSKVTQASLTQTSSDSGPTSSSMASFSRVSNVEIQTKLAGQRQDQQPLITESIQGARQSQPQLRCVLPDSPIGMGSAPFPVIWEVARIAQSCAVDLSSVSLNYSSSWTAQKNLRSALWKHDAFRGKAFPASVSIKAWEGSLDPASLLFDQHVVYSASLDFTNIKAEPLRLTLQSPKVEQSHRLGRQFGSDRFLELLVPSPDNSNLPQYLKKDESFFEDLIQWLTGAPHAFCGRHWRPFYTKDGGAREPVKDLSFGQEKKKVYQNRVYFFAEHGTGLSHVPLHLMLHWLLDFKQAENRRQPVLKLFQRIAIALSTTSPTVVFEPSQIRHRSEDILSPSGKVMNDGVARMSRAVARQIRDRLGLRTCPSAVQGRLGSAKGMWVIDVTDTTDKIWIETYPSQRKWDLDWETVDDKQRTLEVLNVPSNPRSARLNLQFLPVIEDRATNKDAMRKATGYLLQNNLQNDLNSQKAALERPIQFRQWIHENSSHRHDRASDGHIAYQGGLPQHDEEIINSMLDAGFHPTANKFLADLTFTMQRAKCETLKRKLNITVGRSANLYMVVDFLGVLEENEVHVGFSTAFEADDDWNKTMLQGEAIVARSPAHFISDIQKVKVVFRPELADLTDVIIFSSKGDVPLADKLSGGDYDGDLAWVCWDPRLVANFENAEVQEQPDLSRYIRKDKIQFRQLLKSHKKDVAAAVSEMMVKCFAFNLTKSMLGSCTNYKESLCYSRGNVCDDVARILSTLLSNLVDQAKQGIEFTDEDLRTLKKDLAKDYGVRQEYDRMPAYKSENWGSNEAQKHIIDYLKFGIAQPIIKEELQSLNKALNEGSPEFYDKDLVSYYKKYDELARVPSELGKWVKGLQCYLDQEIGKASEAWDRSTSSWPEKVQTTYELWQAIQPDQAPSLSGQQSTANYAVAIETLLLGGELSHWELWKASFAFNKFKRRRFPWQMAGRQLCHIKAMAVCAKTPGAAQAPAAVVPQIHASLRPDPKFIKLMVAMMEGQGSQFMDQRDDNGDDE